MIAKICYFLLQARFHERGYMGFLNEEFGTMMLEIVAAREETCQNYAHLQLHVLRLLQQCLHHQ